MRPLLRGSLLAFRLLSATLVLYITIVGFLSTFRFGGVPMIQRLLPLQNPGGPSHSLVRFREVASSAPVDLVFLGASHTYRGFDPRFFAKLGHTSLNLGSSSQTPLNTVTLLKRHISTLKPRLAIYEIYHPALALDGMESFYDLLSNTPIDIPMMEMAWSLQQPQAWTALLATGFRNLRSPASGFVQRGKEGRDDLYIKGGYVQTRATMPIHRLEGLRKMFRDHAPTNTTAGPAFSPRQLQFLSECVEIVRRQGGAFIACSYPVPEEMQALLPGFRQRQEEVARFFQRLGVPYKDFNVDMTLDTAIHYYDEVHLNQAGVELFNASLIEWLRRENLLSGASTPR